MRVISIPLGWRLAAEAVRYEFAVLPDPEFPACLGRPLDRRLPLCLCAVEVGDFVVGAVRVCEGDWISHLVFPLVGSIPMNHIPGCMSNAKCTATEYATMLRCWCIANKQLTLIQTERLIQIHNGKDGATITKPTRTP